MSQVATTGFVSSKAPALLAYLATTGRPHFRAALAALLWSELGETAARMILRHVLSNFRQHLAPTSSSPATPSPSIAPALTGSMWNNSKRR